MSPAYLKHGISVPVEILGNVIAVRLLNIQSKNPDKQICVPHATVQFNQTPVSFQIRPNTNHALIAQEYNKVPVDRSIQANIFTLLLDPIDLPDKRDDEYVLSYECLTEPANAIF
jgi:hypothetical protein